jgi:hypothetical protein
MLGLRKHPDNILARRVRCNKKWRGEPALRVSERNGPVDHFERRTPEAQA